MNKENNNKQCTKCEWIGLSEQLVAVKEEPIPPIIESFLMTCPKCGNGEFRRVVEKHNGS